MKHDLPYPNNSYQFDPEMPGVWSKVRKTRLESAGGIHHRTYGGKWIQPKVEPGGVLRWPLYGTDRVRRKLSLKQLNTIIGK